MDGGDGPGRLPFVGQHDTAAAHLLRGLEPAREGRAVERQSVTARRGPAHRELEHIPRSRRANERDSETVGRVVVRWHRLGERGTRCPCHRRERSQGERVDDQTHAYTGVIRALNTAIKQLAREIATQLGEHPDHTIFTSLPRSGSINAAQMLAEWGDCREAYDTPEAVCALAGLAPVTKHSGKHHAVHFRWACNTRFRNAVTTFADNSRHSSPWAASVYQRARDRGCDHPPPCGYSPEHGSASSGAAGPTAPPTTPTATAAPPSSPATPPRWPECPPPRRVTMT